MLDMKRRLVLDMQAAGWVVPADWVARNWERIKAEMEDDDACVSYALPVGPTEDEVTTRKERAPQTNNRVV